MGEPGYVEGNRKAWGKLAVEFGERAPVMWAGEPNWGCWSVPESQLKVLPEALDGIDAVELGCGTAYVSAWLAKRGARVTGIDPTPEQLATARAMQARFGLTFPLVEGIGEELPFEDESFDLAISEYGAALWADPYKWIPEAARVLRTGGKLIFLSNHPISVLCEQDYETDGPQVETLLRPYFGMGRTNWPDCPDETEFHLTHGDMIALLVRSGFSIDRLLEIQVPEDAKTSFTQNLEWCRKWPCEEIWFATKR